MKKISYMLLGLLALVMGACDSDDFTDWAQPQTNPQENAITIPGLTASSVSAFTLTGTAATDSVSLYSLSTAALPEGYTLGKARIELTPSDATGAATVEEATTLEGKTAAADVQKIIEDAYGKRPVARTFSGHVYLDATKDGQAVYIDAGQVNVTVTPITPDVASAYYIIGAPQGWTGTDKSLKFNHSDKDVYEDPVFTITFKVPDETADTWFAFADDKGMDQAAAGSWDNVFGASEGNGNNVVGQTSKFARRSVIGNDGSFKVPAGAKYIRMTINVLDETYLIEALNFDAYLYEIGTNTSNWQYAIALYGANGDGKYFGAFHLMSGFKFRNNLNDWNGNLNLGQDGNNRQEGVLINSGGSSDIQIAHEGNYAVNVDAAALTYTLTEFQAMGIIGDGANGWDDNDDVMMTYNAADHTWVADHVALKAGSIKFRADHKWNIVNLGGTLDALQQGSNDNVAVTTPGTYKVVLHLENSAARMPYAELIAE